VEPPVTDVNLDDDTVRIAGKGPAVVDEVLAAWRRHLVALDDGEPAGGTYTLRWGEDDNVEQMLEHAIVHPMRHRIQLERLMRASGRRETSSERGSGLISPASFSREPKDSVAARR
jgi:hypothetical protein